MRSQSLRVFYLRVVGYGLAKASGLCYGSIYGLLGGVWNVTRVSAYLSAYFLSSWSRGVVGVAVIGAFPGGFLNGGGLF